MSANINRIRDLLRQLWIASPALTGAGAFMLVVLVASLAGVAIDSRVITGAPAWLKPAKFAVSTTIYMLTLAWVFTHLSEWPRMRRFVGGMTAIILVLEVAIIDLQAWRGTTSHFNFATGLDGALFSIMGLAIVVQTVTSISVAVALWRQRFADRALGWALRLGMALTIVGASTGGLMTGPTSAQLDQRSSDRPHAYRGCTYRWRAGWRRRSAGHRVESRARRPSRPALHRLAWFAGASRSRAPRPSPMARYRARAARVRCGCELCLVVWHSAVAGASRSVTRAAGLA